MKTTAGHDVPSHSLELVHFDESLHGQPFEILRDPSTGSRFLRCEGLVMRLLPPGSDFATRFVECGHVALSAVEPGEQNYCSACGAWRTTDPAARPPAAAAAALSPPAELSAGRLISAAVRAQGLRRTAFPRLLARRAEGSPEAPDRLSTSERVLMIYTLAARARSGRALLGGDSAPAARGKGYGPWVN